MSLHVKLCLKKELYPFLVYIFTPFEIQLRFLILLNGFKKYTDRVFKQWRCYVGFDVCSGKASARQSKAISRTFLLQA